MTIDPELAVFALGSVATIGGAWGAARAGANGVRARVKEIGVTLASQAHTFKQHTDEDHAFQITQTDRMARVETLLSEIHDAVVRK